MRSTRRTLAASTVALTALFSTAGAARADAPAIAPAGGAAARPSGRVTAAHLAPAGGADQPGQPGGPDLPGPGITIDGRLEEPAWDGAPGYDAFIQVFPNEGAAPSERTEVRVLFDDRALYIGITAHDSRPAEIRRPMGRRDNVPFSDQVMVAIDSLRDGRSAYLFTVSAAGVLQDALLGDDDQPNVEWDAIWEGAAATTADGWSAELAIPLAVLRFPDRPDPRFGFAVKRTLGRNHEDAVSVFIPRNARGQARHLGELAGLAGIRPVRDVELTPYLAAKLQVRPRIDDALKPRPRMTEAIGDVGLDFRTSLGPALAVQGTVNPDFGQVEADQLIQNLSTFEFQFPEKRPFFTQGMDLFRPVTPVYRQNAPFQLFYSRRIGLDAPILGAAKLSGSAGDDLQVGLLEAVVMGAGSGRPDGAGPGGLAYHAEQPFRIGPRSSVPALAPATRNFAVGVASWRPDPRVTLGATATSTALIGPDCTYAAANPPGGADPPARCDTLAGHAAAVDWNLRTADSVWFTRGATAGSIAMGGGPERVLPDGTVLHRGDPGAGVYASAGKMGGEPWRFELSYEYQSPRLELNAAGFQRTQNEQAARATLRHVRPTGGGPFHSYAIGLIAEQKLTTDGRALDRGAMVLLSGEFQLRSFNWLGFDLQLDRPRWDNREIDQSSTETVVRGGVPQRRPGDWILNVWTSTDQSRPIWAEGGATWGTSTRVGVLAPRSFYGVGGKVIVRPHPRFETRLDLSADRNRWRGRWIQDVGGTYYFADLEAPVLSATLRQQVVLAPRLTLQAYAQLFTTWGRYTRGYRARPDGRGRIPATALLPVDLRDPAAGLDNPDFREGALDLNLVLRWEFRLGSTLYLVYTRTQGELGYEDGTTPPATLRPVNLAHGPTTDAVLAKWAWYWRG